MYHEIDAIYINIDEILLLYKQLKLNRFLLMPNISNITS